MRIVMIGLNHRTADVALREKLAFNEQTMQQAINALHRQYPNIELAMLCTCNRTEIYLARPAHEAPSPEDIRRFMAQLGHTSVTQLTAVTIHREQDAALRHLFRVAAGLDSMVVGETQILGQVKEAYDLACRCRTIGPVLHRVFHEAITTARQVRRDTDIGAGRVSVGSVAVEFAQQIFEDFTDKTVLSIGAGEMVKLMLRHLVNLAPRHTWLINRSMDRALELAEQLNTADERCQARAWEEMQHLLVDADIVLTCTGADEPIVTESMVRGMLRKRHHRPLFIVDIAVPRDVEPSVGTLNNVYLYNIDDLQQVVTVNTQQRGEHVAASEAMVNQAIETCMAQLQHRDIGRLIRLLRARLHDLGDLETQRTLRKLSSITDKHHDPYLQQVLNEHTHRLINKVLHLPLSQLDQRNPHAPLGFYAAALRRLFDLKEDESTDSHTTTTSQDDGNEEQ